MCLVIRKLKVKIAIFFCSATSHSILDKAIDSEEAQHNDFLRLVRLLPFFPAF